jgi:hypothetical protein
MADALTRREFVAGTGVLLLGGAAGAQGGRRRGQGGGGGGRRGPDDYVLPAELAEFDALSLVLGRPTDRSVTAAALAREATEAYLEYGPAAGAYTQRTELLNLAAGQPLEVALANLKADTEYFYRLQYRRPGQGDFTARAECRCHTQRAPGSEFCFGVQGDSHPERPQMNDPALYARTLLTAGAAKPDFYVCLGDDFSVDTLPTLDEPRVTARYTLQRPFLGLVAQNAPLYLVNGNHEQASLFNYSQTDQRHLVAVAAQLARNRYYPLPAPDGFYTGDREPLPGIGPLRDYYAWTWGDGLFVVLDNYWHSPAMVDNGLHEGPNRGQGQGGRDRDWWNIGLGQAQYQWFAQTLEQSRARHKFVFAHHVMGTGRGGVDQADLYEWGGRDRRGDNAFAQHRPGWELPIHQLMAKHRVSIFFQGHDHLYCRQERDGVVYQEVPMPADQGYQTYNAERYQTGAKLPNSGYLKVTVSPARVKVDYVRSWLPKDETADHRQGEIAASYSLDAGGPAV